jgi:hypothetical protein
VGWILDGDPKRGKDDEYLEYLGDLINHHQQPDVNYPRFSKRSISPARYTLSVYRSREIK